MYLVVDGGWNPTGETYCLPLNHTQNDSVTRVKHTSNVRYFCDVLVDVKDMFTVAHTSRYAGKDAYAQAHTQKHPQSGEAVHHLLAKPYTKLNSTIAPSSPSLWNKLFMPAEWLSWAGMLWLCIRTIVENQRSKFRKKGLWKCLGSFIRKPQMSLMCTEEDATQRLLGSERRRTRL